MPIRETFWNIPHWAEIAQYIFGFLALAILAVGTAMRFRRWRQGRPAARLDQPLKRLGKALKHGLLQFRTASEPFPAVMHLSIFWGMLVLILGTALATVDWDVTHLFFNFQFLKDGIYVVYELTLDIFGLLLLLGLGLALYRRYLQRPARLHSDEDRPVQLWDDALTLALLVLIAISGYLVEGLRLAITQPEWGGWSPVGNAIAGLILAGGDPNNESLHLAIWITHIAVSFGVIAAIPFTKLFHAIAGPVNIFFHTTQPLGRLEPAHQSSAVGVSEWRHLTWKQLLDLEACIRCGRCQEACPAHASGAPLSPRALIQSLKEHVRHDNGGRSLHGDVVAAQALWSCTSCLACSSACPMFIEHLSTLVDLRRYLVYQGQVDPMLQDALANLGRYGNSFGKSDRRRAAWTRGLEPVIKDARKEAVETLWFVGDYASYHANLTEVTRSTAQLFQLAKLDFGLLYDGERNAGNDVRRAGEEGLFEMLRDDNTEQLDAAQFERIVTTDPHSFNTLKNEYGHNGGPAWEVLHHSQLLDEMIAEGRLTLKRKLDMKVTYQDPCYLGRYNGIYDAPRRVIHAAGCQMVEMPDHAENAQCCGAGGGHIWMEEGEGESRPSERRIEEIAAMPGVEALIVACPKDVAMFQDAIKTTGNEEKLQVLELVDVVHAAL